jgi:hypothetical protein
MSTQSPTEENLKWQLKQAREALAEMIEATMQGAPNIKKARARLNAKRVMELIK